MAFDSSLYNTIPQARVSGTIALIRAVITASKGVVGHAGAKKALRRARDAGEALSSLYYAAPKAKSASVTKELDNQVDRIWAVFESRLAAWLELGGADGEEAERIKGILFPDGMGFLKFRYNDQWTVGEAILARVTSEELEASLDKLVGAPFLEAVRARQKAYGDGIGITKEKAPVVDEAELNEPLRLARAALSTYARVVASAVDNEEITEKIALSALAPIDELRTSLRASKKKGASKEEPVVLPSEHEPLPPVD